jgi:acyl-CoA dehydrogenase
MDFTLGEEDLLIQSTVRDLAEKKFVPRAAKIDEESIWPEENLKELGELGLLGTILDQKYGGAGASTLSYAVTLEEIAKACASTSVITSVTTMVGNAIQREGSEEQKEKYIPKISNGEIIGAFCLTEPSAGSDAGSLKSTAVVERDQIILNGQKLWISNAHHAGVFLVMANENPEQGAKGISAFLIDKDTPGLTIGKPEKKTGLNGSLTAAIFMDNVKIPLENRLGESGKGFSIALKSLDTGRIGIAAQAVGIAQAAFNSSVQYAKEREQFGKPIGEFQGVSFRLADMKMKLDAARLLTYRAAWMKDKGKKHTMESSIAKAYATEAAFDITAAAIRTHGGMGFSKELPIERYHRDIQATLLYEGTNDIQRVVISRNLLS